MSRAFFRRQQPLKKPQDIDYFSFGFPLYCVVLKEGLLALLKREEWLGGHELAPGSKYSSSAPYSSLFTFYSLPFHLNLEPVDHTFNYGSRSAVSRE